MSPGRYWMHLSRFFVMAADALYGITMRGDGVSTVNERSRNAPEGPGRRRVQFYLVHDTRRTAIDRVDRVHK